MFALVALVTAVCKQVVSKSCLQHYVKFPKTEAERAAVGNAFGIRKKWSWPLGLCLGALDGSHIPVKAEGLHRLSYLNWHEWFSINLMAIVDSNMSFVYAFTGRPGRMGDSRVFKDSSFYRRMVDSATRLFPLDYFIIGATWCPVSGGVAWCGVVRSAATA